MRAILPRIGQEFLSGNRVSKPFYDWFNQLQLDASGGSSDLEAIRAAIAELQAAVAALEQAVTLFQSQIDILNGQVSILNTIVASLQAQIDAINALLVFVTYSTGISDGDKITRTRPDGILDPTITLSSLNLMTRNIKIPADMNLLFSEGVGLAGDYDLTGDGNLIGI